jgi:biopolymer transport protein TolR
MPRLHSKRGPMHEINVVPYVDVMLVLLVIFMVTAPLLNLNGGNRERSAGELLIASADRRATELRVSNDVRAAIEAAQALDAGTRGFDAGFVARAAVVAEAAEASYREGAASLVELLDAFRAAADARAAFVRGTLDRALARLDLRRAMGAPAVEVP